MSQLRVFLPIFLFFLLIACTAPFLAATTKPKVDFETGEMVRIISGPFANFTGMVEEYDLDHGKLKLNVSIFGRNTPVEILYTQVEKII